MPASLQAPKAVETHQLFQSLEWLRPTPDASLRDHLTWSELEAHLRRVGTRPQPKQDLYGSAKMRSALEQLGVQFKLGIDVKGYFMTAVVQPQISTARPILCAMPRNDCFTNDPSR